MSNPEPPPDATPEAPYGYMTDPVTKQRRPKLRPGRVKAKPPPGTEGIKPDHVPGADQDVPPGRTEEPLARAAAARAARSSVPMPRAGMIARAVNRLYRRAGKALRAWDADVGQAFIYVARDTSEQGEPDNSVGAAWEELAKTNPRIRAVLTRLMAGGAWAAVAEAHLPIVVVVLMKDSIANRIPFGRLLRSMAEPDEDSPPGGGGLPGGLSLNDLRQAAEAMPPDFMNTMMRQMGGQPPPA